MIACRTSSLRNRSLVVVGILLMCVCVLMQMLGVPSTLLSPSDSSDLLGSSVLEGLSVPPHVPEVFRLVTSAMAVVLTPAVPISVVASVLFHPPVR